MLTIRSATSADAYSLAPRLRKADLAEIEALGLDPHNCLLEAVVMGWPGSETFTAEQDGLVIAMFGINPFEGPDGLDAAVWMVGSDDALKDKAAFLREANQFIQRAHKKYPLLWNIVDCRNSVHINWLKRSGFVAIRRHEHLGVEQRPFFEFIRIDTSCVPSPQPA